MQTLMVEVELEAMEDFAVGRGSKIRGFDG